MIFFFHPRSRAGGISVVFLTDTFPKRALKASKKSNKLSGETSGGPNVPTQFFLFLTQRKTFSWNKPWELFLGGAATTAITASRTDATGSWLAGIQLGSSHGEALEPTQQATDYWDTSTPEGSREGLLFYSKAGFQSQNKTVCVSSEGVQCLERRALIKLH